MRMLLYPHVRSYVLSLVPGTPPPNVGAQTKRPSLRDEKDSKGIITRPSAPICLRHHLACRTTHVARLVTFNADCRPKTPGGTWSQLFLRTRAHVLQVYLVPYCRYTGRPGCSSLSLAFLIAAARALNTLVAACALPRTHQRQHQEHLPHLPFYRYHPLPSRPPYSTAQHVHHPPPPHRLCYLLHTREPGKHDRYPDSGLKRLRAPRCNLPRNETQIMSKTPCRYFALLESASSLEHALYSS